MRAELREHLDAAERFEGGTMFVSGRAQMNAVVTQAQLRGFTVLLARGTRAERHRDLAVFAQLARPALPHLQWQRADARPGVALQRVVLGLAEETPMLVAVRDAQWADDASLAWLNSLARRIRSLPVAIVIGVASGDVPDPLAQLRQHSRALGSMRMTCAEARVAALAATGMSNREIAQTLGVLRRSVESHLTTTYRKLDIAGRAELATPTCPRTAGRRTGACRCRRTASPLSWRPGSVGPPCRSTSSSPTRSSSVARGSACSSRSGCTRTSASSRAAIWRSAASA